MKTNHYELSRSVKLLAIVLLVLLAPLFSRAQTTVTIGDPASTVSSNVLPANGYYDYSWSAQIYKAAEIGTTGNITQISFDVFNTPTSYLMTNQKIYLAAITDSAFASLAYITPTSVGASEVFNGNLTYNGAGWLTITLANSFTYTGGNLLVLFENYDGSWTSGYPTFRTTTSTPANMSKYNYTDASFPTTDGTYLSERANIKFFITPLVANDAGVISINNPAPPASPGTQAVSATIKNYGTSTLTSATLNWSVNGVTQTPYSWTGSLVTAATSSSITLGTYNFPNGNATINVWTSAPNSSTDLYTANDTISTTLFFSLPLNGTYTIGGATASYPTIAAALADLNLVGVSGPVTFNINDGTYNEQLIFTEVLGASATNTITFQSTTNNANNVIWQFVGTSADNYTFKLNGADYFRFKNLTIKNTDATYGRVIDLTGGAHYNIFESNRIISGGNVNSTTACVYDGNTLNHYNTYLNNYLENGYYGFYIYGVGTTSWEKGTVIQGNEIVLSGYYPINAYYHDSIQIVGNKIHSGASAYSYGISCYYPNNQYRIVGNSVYLTGTSSTAVYGIRDYYGNYYSYNASPTGFGMVANNIVSIIGGTGTNYGLYAYNSSGTEYYYNTIHVTGVGTSGRALYQYNTTSNTYGQTFKNNIFSNTGGGFAAYYGTPTMVTAADYNDYYATGAYVAYWTANRATLADMQNVSLMDVNSISAMPGYVSNYNLHNSALATYQTATPLTAVTDDIDGQARHASTPSMGADEYILYTLDAGVTAMVEPMAVCPGVSSVKVNVKNYGIQSYTGVTVNWSVNGVAQTPYVHTGSIAAGATELVTIGTYNFLGSVVYNLVFSTNSPNSSTDQNLLNDTLFYNGFQTAMSGTYTIGGTSADFSSIAAAATALNTFGICGPVVFNIAAGTYTENISLNAIVGSSSVNTITFKSANNDKTSVNVQYAATSTADNYVLKLNGTSYITFKHISFQATGASYGRVIEFSNGTNYNVISNCDILTSNSTSSSFVPVYYVSGISSNQVTLDSNVLSGGYYGVYWYGTSTAKHNNFTFSNNILKDYYYYGLYIYYVDSIKIDNNTLTNSAASGTLYGIYNYYTNGVSSIQNNKIYTKATGTVYGIAVLSKGTTPAEVMTIANNVINSTSTATSTVYGLYLSSSNYVDLYHNTSNVNVSSSTSSRALYLTAGTNINIKNNIFANLGGGYAYYVGTTTAVLSSDYNDYYTTGANVAYWTANKADVTALQTANSMDIASIGNNPVFASAAVDNLTPLSIGVDNLGASLGYTVDAFGSARSLTTPDMGAIEFTGLSADMAFVSASIKNGYCLSTTDSIFVKVANVIGSAVNFATNPLTIKWSVTGPVNSSDSIVVSAGTLAPADDSIFVGTTVNLSVPGVYTLSTYIKSNAVNAYGGNDSLLNVQVLDVLDPYYVQPHMTVLNNGIDTVELTVRSKYLPGGNVFISEICQFKYTAPAAGWPSYLLADDYIEITGVPNSDIGGLTLEQWNTALASTYTFPSGTLLSPNGTAILAVGEMGSSVASPANFYYHANGAYSSSWSSSTTSGRILKDASGNIIDAVGYSGFVFPAAANVTSADWSNSLAGGSSTSGIRLTAPDNNTGSSWTLTSTSVLQDPNTANTGITVPSPGVLTNFSWSTNGIVTSVNSIDTVVGPYTTSGVYTYVANYMTTCGLQSDSAIVKVFAPSPLIVSNDTAICAGTSVDLSITFNGTAPWTFVGTDGTTVDTFTNITTNPYIISVNPADTTTYTVLEFWDAMNIPSPSNVSMTVYVKSTPIVSMDTVADICESGTAVTLVGSPTGGTFSGMGVVGATFDPAVAGEGAKTLTYSLVGANGCIGTATSVVNVLGTPAITAGMDQTICMGDSALLEVQGMLKDPFFSEYQEGSSNHKIVEIFNGTGATINLDNYAILTNANGSAWTGMYTFPIGATLADGDVYVIANDQADTTLLNVADEALAYNAKGYMTAYNGDDVRALVKFDANGDTIIVDLIGLYNMVDPGTGWAVAGVANATANHTLVRKANAGPNYGDFATSQGTDSLTSEWLVYPQNTWTFAGSHTFATAAAPVTYNYLWSNTAATAATSVMPMTTTTYNVTVTNPATSCFAIDSVIVNVNALPVFNIGNNFDLCENDMTTLDAGAGFAGYLWSNMATSQTINFYGYDLGVGTTTIYAGVLDSNGCANVDSVDVNVLAAPVVNLGADYTMDWIADVDTLDAGAGYSSYLWSNNWSAQTLVVSQAINQVGANTYWVVVTDGNNCTGTDTIVINVIDDTGFDGAVDMISVKVYPNPATDNFNISMNGFVGAVQMEIVDVTGKVVYTENLDITNHFVKSMDVTTLAKGIYYIKLTTAKHSQMHKIVVQ
jgi:hypothetical protein